MNQKRGKNSFFIIIFLSYFLLSILYPSKSFSQNLTTSTLVIQSETNFLYEGKKALDNGDYNRAIVFLSVSIEKLPILTDYALLWRAEAQEKKGEIEKALEDLNYLNDNFKDISFKKAVRKKIVQLYLKLNSHVSDILLKQYVSDYSDDMEMKFIYAKSLKNQGKLKEAKNLFKEVFLSNSPLSYQARQELSDSELTVIDLIRKGENLNKVYLFKESEKYFREALSKKPETYREDIFKGLAESLFRQKKYKESAELYKKTNSYYWYARSLLRAGEIKTFESELSNLMKVSDPKIAKVLISYGNKKRREGDLKGAIKIFNETLQKYPAAKEEALWAKGWTYYMSKDYNRAHEIFSQLYHTYHDIKYLYWQCKAKESTDKNVFQDKTINVQNLNDIDYYTILYIAKSGGTITKVTSYQPKNVTNSEAMQKIDILKRLGFKKEAINELIYLSRRINDLNSLQQISYELKELGNYRMAISILSRGSYKTYIHEILYPLAYWNEILEASITNDLDPYLVLSIMREESRFDEEARSIAGAIGLMQIMPQTALRLNNEINIAKNPPNLYNPKINILLATHYLKNLLKEFKSIAAVIAAYNAGENAVREWLKNNNYHSADEFIEDIPFDETKNYVKKVLVSYVQYKRTISDNITPLLLKVIETNLSLR
ncbi:MAG: transglycosylase SLT domain-containing protein [Thermodesulfovibrionales bacterium]|nr:transglycosylase SLT domain-containing protein [Thermodesulfovibrionales bacterium]